MKYDSVIFDLDGTLWNSAPEIAMTWQEVLTKQPDIKKAPTQTEIEGVMGMTSDDLMSTLFPYISAERGAELFELCCEAEMEHLKAHGATLYPDLIEVLEKLSAELPLFIVSNCNDGYIESFFEGHGTGKYFSDHECIGRTGKLKFENIMLVAERNNLKSSIYVGDTPLDYDSATKAGLPFIHASYGFGKVDGVQKIDKPLDLLEIILD